MFIKIPVGHPTSGKISIHTAGAKITRCPPLDCMKNKP